MAHKTAKAVYKTLTFRDLTIIIKKQKVLTELLQREEKKDLEKSGWWIF